MKGKRLLILPGLSADMLNCEHLLNDQNLSLWQDLMKFWLRCMRETGIKDHTDTLIHRTWNSHLSHVGVRIGLTWQMIPYEESRKMSN